MDTIRALVIAPYPEMVPVVEEVAREFPDISVTVEQGDLEGGLVAALGSFRADYDVVLSRGGTAQMLQDEISLPVIDIALSAADLLTSLATANPGHGSVAVLGFSNTLGNIEQVRGLVDYPIDVFGVTFEDEVPLRLEEIRARDYDVLLCDNVSYRSCRAANMPAHLLLSGPQSVREAFARAAFLCETSAELRSKNRILWQLVQNHPGRVALFSPTGQLMYSNLANGTGDLVAFMREHLDAGGSQRLELRREGRAYHLRASQIEDGETSITAFYVTSSKLPTANRLLGIETRNRADVEHDYRASTFRVTHAGEALAQLTARANEGTRPVLLEGELGCGRTQVASLLYLSGPWSNQPYVSIDCALVVDEGWHYLFDNYRSPLYDTGLTIFLKGVQVLEGERLAKLLEVARRTDLCTRARVIISASDDESGARSRAAELLADQLHCLVITVPPLRRRASVSQAASLLVDHLARQAGDARPVISDDALAAIDAHAWPRNYIELRQVLTGALSLCDGATISAADVRDAIDRGRSARFSSLRSPGEDTSLDLLRPLDDIERDIVREVLGRFSGNRTAAAKSLGVSRTTLWRMLRKDARDA